MARSLHCNSYLAERELIGLSNLPKPPPELGHPVAGDVFWQDEHAPLHGEVVVVGVQQGNGLDSFSQACTSSLCVKM